MLTRTLLFYTLLIFSFSVHSNDSNIDENEKACSEGDSSECIRAGEHYRYSNKIKAKFFFKTACEFNDASGCTNLGILYSTENSEKANSLYTKGCDLNDADGCLFSGELYAEGNEVKKNKTKAYKLFSKACDVSKGRLCRIAATKYLRGLNGLKKNKIKGNEFLTKAYELNIEQCELNDSLGCFLLGELYATGEEKKRDDVKAYQFFTKVCEIDKGLRCLVVINKYRKGLFGVKKDTIKANELMSTACKNGLQKACSLYKESNQSE